MKYGVPVVATRIAVEGMHMIEGQDCMVADTPREFAEKLVKVYTDCSLWTKLVQSAYAKSMSWFSVGAARQQLLTALMKLHMHPAKIQSICN
jgi:glycosyltransferase involved in cell wall biosynthesis